MNVTLFYGISINDFMSLIDFEVLNTVTEKDSHILLFTTKKYVEIAGCFSFLKTSI